MTGILGRASVPVVFLFPFLCAILGVQTPQLRLNVAYMMDPSKTESAFLGEPNSRNAPLGILALPHVRSMYFPVSGLLKLAVKVAVQLPRKFNKPREAIPSALGLAARSPRSNLWVCVDQPHDPVSNLGG